MTAVTSTFAASDQIVDRDVLGGRVFVDHAGAHGDAANAGVVEDVAVGTAAALAADHVDPEALERAHGFAVGALGFVDLVRPILLLGLEVDLRAILRRRVFERRSHGGDLRIELRLVVTARHADHVHLARHDVARFAAFDGADVGHGLLVDAAKRHVGDGLGRDLDGVDALLRLDARVHLLAVHGDGHEHRWWAPST